MKKSIYSLQSVSVRWWNAGAYYAVSLADALAKAGYKTICLGSKNSPAMIHAKNRYKLPTFSHINLEQLSPFSMIQNLYKLRKFVRSSNINLLNAHRPEDHAFLALMNLFSRNKIPLIRTVSDVRPPKNHLLNRLLHDKGSDFFIFTCQAAYERYQSVWQIFENKSAIIYSAIDTEKFKPLSSPPPLRKSLGISDDQILIGLIARLTAVKDHQTFIKSAKKILAIAPNTRFLISGEAHDITLNTLKKLAKEQGVFQQFIFLEKEDQQDVQDLIGSLDIGVVASKGSEVVCRISVEYMAMGIPQVVTNINVLPEIVENGKNGLVVKAENSQEMADALLKLIGEKSLRKEMGRIARQTAKEKFSYPVLLQKTVGVYERVWKEFNVKL